MFGTRFTRTLLKMTLAMVVCSPALAKTYQHDFGSIEVNEVPQRVVVLGYGSLDYLDQLGVKAVGTSKKLLPQHLIHYNSDEVTNTGSLKEVNYETLFTLKPDIIIAEGRMAKIYKDLSEIAPTYMFTIDTKNYWQTTQKHWSVLGDIFGKTQQANQLITNIQNDIDALNAKVVQQAPKALTVMNNGNKLSMFGPVSRFSFIYQEAGFQSAQSENVKPEARTHGDLISFEYIADAQPDVMFILDRDVAVGKGAGKAKTLFDNALVHSTPASADKRVVFLDPAAWYLTSGGYQATQTMISDLETVIQ